MAQKPTREALRAAEGKAVPDIIKPGLKILFCGINPGLYSGAVGHHFARPGNRFWPSLYASGFTNRLLSPDEERKLLDFALGITNFLNKATARAADLSDHEIITGGEQLVQKVLEFQPDYLAILGIGVYRKAFSRPKAQIGSQMGRIGETKLWVLPNPSGLNAHYQLEDLVKLFSELRKASDQIPE